MMLELPLDVVSGYNMQISLGCLLALVLLSGRLIDMGLIISSNIQILEP